MTNSIRLLVECEKKGFLSKEAAVQVLEKREQIVRSALRKQASAFFVSLFKAPSLEKDAGIGSALFGARTTGSTGRGLLSRFREGGATGPGTVQAPWKDVGSNLAKMLALAGLTAGATAGIGSIMRHSRDQKMQAEIESSYGRMFDEYPKLKEVDERRPGAVQRNFGILAKFAPSLAAEPSVAGAWVHNASELGQVPVDSIKGLAETQRRIDEAAEGRHRMTPKLAPMRAGEFVTKAMLA